jgi:hypothetical protein
MRKRIAVDGFGTTVAWNVALAMLLQIKAPPVVVAKTLPALKVGELPPNGPRDVSK